MTTRLDDHNSLKIGIYVQFLKLQFIASKRLINCCNRKGCGDLSAILTLIQTFRPCIRIPSCAHPLTTRSSTLYPPIHPFIHASRIHPSSHSPTHSLIHHSFFRPSTDPSIHFPIYLSIQPSINLHIHSFMESPVYLSIYPFKYLFT